MHVEEGDLGKPDCTLWSAHGNARGRRGGLTQEERHHLRSGDTLTRRYVIVEVREARPDRCDHHVYHVPAIKGLDSEPEHRQYHSGDDCNCWSR